MERAKRFGLAALMAFLALNIWTGSPLLALWIGSRVQGDESQASMTAVVVVIACLAAFSIGLYQALKYVTAAYQATTGTTPTARSHTPWLRSLSGERPAYGAVQISGAERIVVVTVVVAVLVFEVWFFFFSGSPIG